MGSEEKKRSSKKSAGTTTKASKTSGYRTIKSPPKPGTVSIAAVERAVRKVSGERGREKDHGSRRSVTK
jgi:hypothetical protein